MDTRFYEPQRPACPTCNCEADAATGVEEGTTPKEGDISLCMYCGAVRAFVLEGQRLVGYRALTDADIAALDDETQALIKKTLAVYPQFLAVSARKLQEQDPASLTPGERQILKTWASVPGPKRTGKPDTEVSLTGMLFGWRGESPVLLQMPGSTLFYLACFSTEADLRQIHRLAQAPFERIKQIDDGKDFVSSIPADITIIVDPYLTPEGRIRFTQVGRP